MIYIYYHYNEETKPTIVTENNSRQNYFDESFMNVNPPGSRKQDSPAPGGAGSNAPGVDYGPGSFVIDIRKAAENNTSFRTVLWTGNNLQLTLMNIPAGGEIGTEMHNDLDQFLRIEDGGGMVYFGDSEDAMTQKHPVFDNSAVFIPAGVWHNIVNSGGKPLKLYSVYAPPGHMRGTVETGK